MEKDQKFFTYKNKPLVRCKDTIYYGDMNDDYVIKLDLSSLEKENDLNVANSVIVQLVATDPEVSIRKRIIKTSKKNNLFLALDIADIWLERALKNKTK